MDREERRKRTTRACRELSRRISEIVSPGLGNWDHAWEIVEGPSDALFDLFNIWEESGSDQDLDAVKRGAMSVFMAWKRAESEYQGAGRPAAPNRQDQRVQA